MRAMIRKSIKRLYNRYRCKKFAKCGSNVVIGIRCSFLGLSNIYIGNNVSIGRESILWSTAAKLIIKDNVLIGPRIQIHTGNHDFRKIGKNIIDVNMSEMDESNFGDVIIESDTWIGCNSIILKGVTISRGCVIGAGSVVTKSTEPYGIYGGSPAKKIGNRFDLQEIILHESILNQTNAN